MTKVVAVSSPRKASRLSRVDVAYMLEPAEPLAAIDTSRALHTLLFGPKWGKRYVTALRRNAGLVAAGYFVGLVYRFYGMLVPSQLSGGWWLVLVTVLQLPGVLTIMLSWRQDFVLQLNKSFEFWYFTVINVVWVIALALSYQDARASICLISFLELQNATMTDASVQRTQYLIAATVIGSSFLGTSVLAILLDAIELHDFVLWTTPRGHVLSLEEVLINSIGTVALLCVRIAYRKRLALKHSESGSMQCMSIRCRLKLGLVAQSRSGTNSRNSVCAARPTLPKGVVQLVYADIAEKFPASHVVIGQLTRLLPSNGHARAVFLWCWRIGMITAISLVVFLSLRSAHETTAETLPIATMVFTVASALPFVALHQRQLLRRLYTSFDFVFLVLQIVLLAICKCHLAHWDLSRCATATCILIWIYVIVTNDALTPIAKRRLGWTRHLAVGLALFVLVMHVALGVEMAVVGNWQLTDRVLVDVVVFRRRVRVFGVPFLFSRLFFVVLWLCRILWRLVTASSGDDELVFLLGALQYEDERLLRRITATM